ncbi:MAG: ThuA domain-containing protein [Polyangiales bacterium]
MRLLLCSIFALGIACGDDIDPADAGPLDASPTDARSAPDASADSALDALEDAPSAPRDGGSADTIPDAGPRLPERICEAWPEPDSVDEEGLSFDQTGVPVGVEPANSDAVKVVLLPGSRTDHRSGQHEYFAGCAILAQMLCQTAGVVPVIYRDWPADESTFEDAAAVVFYSDGDDAHPLSDEAHRSVMARHVARGMGVVALHYAVDGNTESDPILRTWLGGNFELGFSDNPLWEAALSTTSDHPAVRGVPTSFTIFDEWYFNMRGLEDAAITPLLQSSPADNLRTNSSMFNGRNETLSWAFERPDGGRSFAFNGGHFHGNWSFVAEDGAPTGRYQRQLVTQGILWAARQEIPAAGAPVAFDEATNQWWWLDNDR